jgi:dCMP deaminase
LGAFLIYDNLYLTKKSITDTLKLIMISPRTQDVLSWDQCFMKIAYVIAQRSKDPSTQAGSVIVTDKNIVIGLGYNGWPRNTKLDDFPWEREGGFIETKYAYMVHAEENAVYNANASTENSTLYCTLFPCNECAKTIIQNGIKEVVYAEDKYHDVPAWVVSRRLLEAAGVKCRLFIDE